MTTMGQYIDTDIVWTAATKKALENMDQISLKRILNAQFGLWPTQADYMTKRLIWLELQRRNKEEKKMEEKKYYSGSVAITTWRTRKPSKGDYVASNHRTDLITFKDGRYFGVLLDPKSEITAKIPITRSAGNKKYAKEEITEAITSAWDKGEYAEDQTDISWIFNPDPSGVTGKLHIGSGEFGYGVTRNELAVSRGAIYYYIPENRDPTVLEFKNGKYVRGDNHEGLAKFTPIGLWNTIFGDGRFYETWADVKDAVVKAINNRKIYVNVPCIPELREENCCIDD